MLRAAAQKKELWWLYQNTAACLLVFVLSSVSLIIVGKPAAVGEKCITTTTHGTV